MLKLIGTPQSRAFRVIWLLEELELSYELVPLSPRDKRVFEYNPSGKIPALIDGDDIIIDSVAICQYLADKHQKLTFTAGTIERAKQDSFVAFALDDLETPLWTYGKNIFALPEDLRVPEILPLCKHEFANGLKIFEQRLGDNEYVMGEKFTVADILLVHILTWARVSGFEIEDGPIDRYMKNARKREGYQRARAVRKKK